MTATLPSFHESVGRARAGALWFECKDGDPAVRAMYDRHYSRKRYRDGRDSKLFVGPGEKLVLMTEKCDAIWVWRRFKDASGQQGVNCSVFRNESDWLSSALIIDAENAAWKRWPGERLYTYVDPKKVQSKNPGYCYLKSGWRKCGITKWNKLLILERLP